MVRSVDLHALRRRIGAQAAPDQQGCLQAAVALGEEAMDDALPGRGLETGAIHEVRPGSYRDFGAALGFGMGLLARLTHTDPRPVLWVSPSQGLQYGIVYPIGWISFGLNPDRLHHLSVASSPGMLWALEEGLASGALAAVVGLLPANAASYDFTASRRLSLRAAATGTTAFLIRHHASADRPTAAVTRWSIASRPSTPLRREGLFMPGIGPPRWQADLVRCKRGQPRSWLVEWDHEAFRFRLASAMADRAAAMAEPAIERQWQMAS
jgi:protein ImuA